MRPTIGITCNYGVLPCSPRRERTYLLPAYTDAIFAAGGLAQPVPLPAEYDEPLLREIINGYDAMVFTGGFDLDPGRFGEAPHAQTCQLHPRRDLFEVDLFRCADESRIPILGICLGHQIANFVHGGRMVQHLNGGAALHYAEDDSSAIDEGQSAFHDVRVNPDSLLARITGRQTLTVNSRHHQGVMQEQVGNGLRIAASSEDGVVESLESANGHQLLTVQWHPEDLVDRPEHFALFEWIVQAAQHTARSRQEIPLNCEARQDILE